MPTTIGTERAASAAEAVSTELRVTLRPAVPADAPFLDAVFVSARADELILAGWPAEQMSAFLRMQADLQRRSYRAQSPRARDHLILRDGVPVGRLMVDRSGEAIAVVDIALLPEHRGGGIGTGLLRGLQAEAATQGRPIRLHVERENPARHLYERLGFATTGGDDLRLAMEWRPGTMDPAVDPWGDATGAAGTP